MNSTVIWRSPAIRSIADEAAHAARSDAKILISGESGVGKEVVARFVHDNSARRSAPFVIINCAGVPDTLLESELFGHERGSFTGAYRDKPGLLETAHGGTVFLDEVGEMSARMQGMLLRFLETGELQRVGSSTFNRRANVRVIAATNRRLMDLVAEGAFREDLYYRLNVVHLEIPPLRERREDIVPLFEHFLYTFASRCAKVLPAVDQSGRTALEGYRWPGNVRELRNLAERMIVRGLEAVTAADLRLPELVKPAVAAQQAAPPIDLADELFQRITRNGESFWVAAYAPFMARDITRDDLRAVISHGLQETRGNYRLLVQLFNMKTTDYKRFLYFLRKHHCHMAFQPFRRIDSGDARALPGAGRFACASA